MDGVAPSVVLREHQQLSLLQLRGWLQQAWTLAAIWGGRLLQYGVDACCNLAAIWKTKHIMPLILVALHHC
ncbi:MAG TPA: hypothetical protein PLM49_07185 [Bacteroidales bacterium]|nr:hypothetical protein [Bacteroidales bacterium]